MHDEAAASDLVAMAEERLAHPHHHLLVLRPAAGSGRLQRVPRVVYRGEEIRSNGIMK
jgi:hypothetical protein